MFPKSVALAASVLLVDAAVWNYDRCDVAAGPAAWSQGATACGGVEQSPIDVCGAVPFPPQVLPRVRRGRPAVVANYTVTALNYNTRHTVTLKNTGHTFEASEGAPVPILRIPGLHFLVGRSELTSIVQPDWTFAQMHWHFGREGNANEGSEHTLYGRRYPAEAHLVHFNPARGANLTAALASKMKDAVLVVGVFLDLGEPSIESNLVKQIAALAPKLQPPPVNTPMNITTQVMLSDIFNATDAYYSYRGSLTTPGCAEQVTWVVMKTPKVISPDSLELLKLVMENANETISKMGNFRPVQPLGTRVVYSSRNITGACQALPVPDPCYDCAAAPAVVLFNAAQTTVEQQGGHEGTTACIGTPAWVWVAIGVSVPAAVIISIAAIFYAAWRRSGPTEKVMMAYSPFPNQCNIPHC